MRFTTNTLFSGILFSGPLFAGHPVAATRPQPATEAAPQVRHDTPRYNKDTGTFEARVDVTRNGATFRYPVSVAAPFDADPMWLSQALIGRALGLSDTPRLH